jgi:hypothetical protein
MKPSHQSKPPSYQRCIALLCVLVIAGFGFVQAVHVHDELAGQTSSPASHCSLCAVAHSAVLISPAGVAPLPVVATSMFAASEPQLLSQLQVAPSYIRPPPFSL